MPRKAGKSSKRKADSNLEMGCRRIVINLVPGGINDCMTVWLYLEMRR